MRLLSIDFDYWMPEKIEWDFGHQENSLMIELMWGIRASHFLAQGIDFRREMSISKDEIVVPEELAGYLKGQLKCQFASNSMAFAESHASAHDWFKDAKDAEIWHIDAHHDIWYGREELNCDNWVTHLVNEGKLRSVNLVYPFWRKNQDFDWQANVEDKIKKWRDRGILFKKYYGLDSLPKGVLYSKTFMCRSGAWVPPWLDQSFICAAMNLLAVCDQSSYAMYTYGSLDGFRRAFDEEEAKKMANEQRILMEEQRAKISG